MTRAVLLRKMNPRESLGLASQRILILGNALHYGASEGENVRLAGVTEERKNEKAEMDGRAGRGSGYGSVAGIGAGSGEESATETGAEPVGGGAGAME